MRMRVVSIGGVLLLGAAFLSIPRPAAAQMIGVTAGINRATLSQDPEAGLAFEPIIRPVGGFYIAPAMERRAGFRIEALLSVKGAHSAGFAETVRFVYLDVPLLIHVRLTSMANSQVYFVGGATVSRLLGANVTLDDGTGSGSIADSFTKFDVGATIGFGIDFRRIVFDVRATRSLLNTDTGDLETTVLNRVISFRLGYRFK